MAYDIKVKVGDVELKGTLDDTDCARTIWDILPIRSSFETWGEEFYFPIGIGGSSDDTAKTEVKVGTIGYWPPGDALAIFFGPTPASTGDEPVAASQVNVVGYLEGADELKKVMDAEEIVMEKDL